MATPDGKYSHGRLRLFEAIGTLREELYHYFKLYNLKLDDATLDLFCDELRQWNASGKSIFLWMHSIIDQIRTKRIRNFEVYRDCAFIVSGKKKIRTKGKKNNLKSNPKTKQKNAFNETKPIKRRWIKKANPGIRDHKAEYYRKLRKKHGFDTIEQAEKFYLKNKEKNQKNKQLREELKQQRINSRIVFCKLNGTELKFDRIIDAINWYSTTFGLVKDTAKKHVFQSLRLGIPTRTNIFFYRNPEN